MRLSRRLTILSLLTWPLFQASPASGAAIPVIDTAAIAKLALQIAEAIRQIKVMEQQVQMMRDAAKQVAQGSFGGLVELFRLIQVNYEAITRDGSGIGYTLQSVNSQFQRIFPNEEAISNARFRDYESISNGMTNELRSAALVAVRAQSTLSELQTTNAAARDILQQSDGNGSQVAQLQLAVQMLAVIQENMRSIVQTINSAGRLTSDMAAAAVTERRVARERRIRLMRNYTRKGSRAVIDRRFLRSR